MSQFDQLPSYIISRGLILACLLLAAAAAVLLQARACPAAFWLGRNYAEHLEFSAQVVLAASLIGGALLKQAVEYTGL